MILLALLTTLFSFADTFQCKNVPQLKSSEQTRIDFLINVGEKSYETIKQNLRFADCAQACFRGENTCITGERCSDVKAKVSKSLQENSQLAKELLLMGSDYSGLVRLDINSISSLSPERRTNQKISSFEYGLPNPFEGEDAIPGDKKRAIERLKKAEANWAKIFKEKGYKSYGRWISLRLMEDLDQYRTDYRILVYQNYPLLSVIGKKPKNKFWSNEQIAQGFDKLRKNGLIVRNAIEKALKVKKLKFSTWNGEALSSWMKEITQVEPDYDLISFVLFKPQITAVIKDRPDYCQLANELYDEKMNEDLKNIGLVIAGSFGATPVLKGVTIIPVKLFKVGRALSGAEASALTGFSMGVAFLDESIVDVKRVKAEVNLGLKNQEEIEIAEINQSINLFLAPTLAPSGWLLGKVLYQNYRTKLQDIIPELKLKLKGRKDLEPNLQVDLFLKKKINTLQLTQQQKIALEIPYTQVILNNLAERILKNDPRFFEDEKKLNLFLKFGADVFIKYRKTPQLDKMAELYFVSLNFHQISLREKEMASLLESGLEVLELTYANDPKLYLKFSSDPRSHELIMLKSLQIAETKTGKLKELGACLRK